jgi:hypothetical protein
MQTATTIQTADGRTVNVGDRVFNYYDLKWGRIESLTSTSDGWFTFAHEDGTKAVLNGERISSSPPSWWKGATR